MRAGTRRLAAWTLMLLSVVSSFSRAEGSQDQVNYIANNLGILYNVEDNFQLNDPPTDYNLNSITLTNNGDQTIGDYDWWLYFCHIRLLNGTDDPESFPDGVPLGESKLLAFHVTGCLHKIGPDTGFELPAGQDIKVDIYSKWWVVSRTDIMPNWYITMDGASPKTVEITNYEPTFVGGFTKPEQYKRTEDDQYEPYTTEARFELYRDVGDLGRPGRNILPTPVEEQTSDEQVTITIQWKVFYEDADLEREAKFLADKLELVATGSPNPSSRYIHLSKGTVGIGDGNNESYSLNITKASNQISITGPTPTGVFWGVQSLLSLCHGGPPCDVLTGKIEDYPRFPFRGMHLDVSRNFHQKRDVFKLLDVMSMYKLNKFHFHLTDDEGWRLEIPDLEELTTVGAHRCHDEDETPSCIMPQLGSDPEDVLPGSGYYTTQEYKEILAYADERHIEVIPEFDMPGHAHAAIIAMEARGEEEYLLTDSNDTSKYLSEQLFTDNAINPCIDSTYEFVRKVVQEVKELHADVQPLKIFHFGGDEVPEGAWVHSSSCSPFFEDLPSNATEKQKRDVVMKEFVVRVADIVAAEGMDMAGWEDGLIESTGQPYNISELAEGRLYYAHAWSNIWEWGNGQRAYRLANAGYKTIISHATHFYFDHPYEPDPEERGYYWAPRFIDTRKTFGYVATDVYKNIDVSRMGEPLDRDETCKAQGCEALQEGKEDNIIGIQGQLWAETVRTSAQLEYMIYPRILAMAERAWHHAPWEDLDDTAARDDLVKEDWKQFVNTLGYKELGRLEKLGVKYAVPPPGAIVSDGSEPVITANSAIPGLSISLKVGDGAWEEYRTNHQVAGGSTVQLKTWSRDRTRESRIVTLTVPESEPGPPNGAVSVWSGNFSSMLFILLLSSVFSIV